MTATTKGTNMATATVTDAHIAEAREMGRAAGLAAASWCADGNTTADHARRVLAMLDDGDPEAYDFLPQEPNLSGQFADDPTPTSLARDILGDDYTDDDEGAFVLCDAWEEGVMETFAPECERILRAILPDDIDLDDAPMSCEANYRSRP